jgi:hypothetical protein
MDETEIVYNVSVPRMSRNAAILIGFGVLVYFVSKSDFHACFANQPCDPRVMIAFPGSFILVVMGLLAIFGAFKQLPRLTLSAEGVVYQSLYKTRQVSWEHLGPFQRVVPNKATLRAAVMEPLAPGMMAPPRPLVIMPSIFGKKIGFEDELNEHRRRFTPGAVPVRLGAASVPGAEPSVEVLRGWDVLWRGFIVFVSQWLLLLAAGAVMVIAILASKAMSGGPPPDPVKIFTVSLLCRRWGCIWEIASVPMSSLALKFYLFRSVYASAYPAGAAAVFSKASRRVECPSARSWSKPI